MRRLQESIGCVGND